MTTNQFIDYQAALSPGKWCILVLNLGLDIIVIWHYVVSSMDHSWNNYVMNVCFTYNIYWSLSDYYCIEKTTLPPSCWPGSSSCRGILSLRCRAFAWLNDCANSDEADVMFVQTRKTQSLYYFYFNLQHAHWGVVWVSFVCFCIMRPIFIIVSI